MERTPKLPGLAMSGSGVASSTVNNKTGGMKHMRLGSLFPSQASCHALCSGEIEVDILMIYIYNINIYIEGLLDIKY